MLYLNNKYKQSDPYRRSHLNQHLSVFRGVFFISQPDIEPDRCALNNVHYRYWFLDLWVYFRHAPARLRIAANMFALARGYAAVCWLVPLLSAQGATQAGFGVRLVVRGYITPFLSRTTYSVGFVNFINLPFGPSSITQMAPS